MLATWHVYFDHEPAVRMHACDWCHAVGQSLPCGDDDCRDGDCEHVQTRPCDCEDSQACAVCEDRGR
jgi:hypothetical protein